MSSSVFIERNVTPKTAPDVMSSDSNLVVVYGKNGINLDQESVQTILEEKSISTISVVRLTSPTPSMIAQEESERLEEIERFNNDLSEDSDADSDGDDACSSNADNNKSDNHITGDDHDSSQDENDDNNAAESVVDIPKVRKKPGRKPKIIKKIKKRRKPKERPEIVGLTVEEFYADNIAHELVKNALKIAGVPLYKRTAKTDALLEIIQNDHNYTPFTSPEQMRAHKAAERLEAENRAAQSRKLMPLASNNLRNFNTKKKLHLQQTTLQAQASKEKVKGLSLRTERLNSLKGNRVRKNYKEYEEYIDDDDDEDINSNHSNNANEDDLVDNLDSNEEYDESDLSDDSRFTDNDRDSDIDFNLNNRHTPKRKRSTKSKRQPQQVKQQQQQQQQQSQPIVQKPTIVRRVNKQIHEQSSVPTVKAAPVTNAVNTTFSTARVTVRISKSTTPQILKIMSINKPMMSTTTTTTAQATDVPPLNRSVTTSINTPALPLPPPSPSPLPCVAAKTPSTSSLASSFPSSSIGVRRTPIVKVGVPSTTPIISSALSRSSQLLSSPKDVKEIVINKNLNSPKGVFTNLNTLLNESCASPISLPNTITKIKNTPPTGITIITQSNESTLPTQLSSKGFMPIGVDTAASNQLPSQISIHTHQSSSELAAENERQLDLIDSIVKDELQKASLVEQQPTTTDENIPKLIKMLESTADVLSQQNNMQQQQQQQQPIIQQPTVNVPSQLNSFLAVPNVGPLVGDIDISNAPLLETPDDDITADFLQHVVGLIEDDKQFKEEVEKEVFGVPFNSEPMVTSTINNSTIVMPNVERNEPVLIMPPLAIEQHHQSSTVLNGLQQQNLQMINTVAEASTLLPKPSNLSTSTPIRNINNDQTFTAVETPRPTENQVQIVRGNGRVITLPPIEAPATRARRRAQSTFSSDINSINYSESSLDSSIYSNASASLAGNESHLQQRRNSVMRKSIEINNMKRRASSRDKASTPAATPTRSAGGSGGDGGRKRNASSNKKKSKANTSKKSVESELSDSQEDEDEDDDDDPNKLWCICRQPHNNRFMICCDSCQDWFHGTCVSITKSMGREIEDKGIEWTCPNCNNKEEAKKQPRITDMLQQNKKQNLSITTTSAVTESPNKSNNSNERDASGGVVAAEILNINQKDYNNKSQIATNARNFSRPTNAANIQPKKINTVLKVIPMTPKRVEPSIVLHTNNNKSPATTSSPNNTKLTPKTLHQQQLNFPKMVTLAKPAINNGPPCIVCKKPSRGSSIYCSDECIRKYANNAVQSAQHSTKVTDKEIGIANVVVQDGKKVKKKGLFEDMLLLADSVPKVERINVFERKTGRVLTGHNAPTVLNLKKWLQENPTFEVVQPGTPQAIEIEKRRRANQASASPSSSSSTISKADISIQSVESDTSAVIPSTSAQQQQQPINRPPTVAQQVQSTPKRLNKTESQIGNKTTDKIDKRRQTLDSNKATPDSSFSKQKPEPIRLNVRRTFKEQLLLRIKEAQEQQNTQNDSIDNKALADFNGDNVEQFAKSVESEMYNLFGKDTGAKYKAKYRSLMFNIKDRKNKTLFAKICAKQIEPKQLVRMSPEELASQELAMWRANENKHQLEIIKKSEMDLLACNKTYVLKTHKGEEVIEGKSNDFLILDATLAADAADKVVSHHLISQSPGTPTKNTGSKISEMENSSSTSTSHKTTEKSKSKEITRDKNKEKGIDGRMDKKHKVSKEREHRDNHHHHHHHNYHHHHHHHHKSHSRKRSRSRSNSRSHGDEKRRKSISHRDDQHTSSSHDRSRDRSNDRRHDHQDRKGREKEDGDHQQHHYHRHHEDKSTNSPERSRNHEQMSEQVKNHKESQLKTEVKELVSKKHVSSKAAKDVAKEIPAQNTMQSFNLVDQILKSVKTVEEAANLVKPKNKETNLIETEEEGEVKSNDDPYILYANKISSLLLWRGEISMVDVSCFNMSLYHLVGTSQKLGKVIPDTLEVVGRICKDTVWEYISKIKKSPTKEVVLVRLFPSSEADVQGYKNLFDYLDIRQRLGVIGVVGDHIRDFYIFPLNAMKNVPPVLQTPNRVDFYEDAERPNILIGIIIRCVAKRGPSDNKNTHSSSPASASAATKLQRIAQKPRSNNNFPPPPASPKRRRISSAHSSKDDEFDIDAIIKAPIASQSQRTNKSSITTKNDGDEPYSPGDSSDDGDVLTLSTPANGDDKEFKRKVEEINKQIAAQRKEIAGLLKVEPTNYDGPSTSSSVLANISIPPNLSKILASIKDKTDFKKMTVKPELPLDEQYNPEEAVASKSSYTRAMNAEKPSSSNSGHLSQLSEAELLSMVPDNIEILSPTETSKSEEPPPPGV